MTYGVIYGVLVGKSTGSHQYRGEIFGHDGLWIANMCWVNLVDLPPIYGNVDGVNIDAIW